MLKIVVPEIELYDEKLNQFIQIPRTTLELEHSLLSLTKWESKWHKTFLSKRPKTEEEILDYVRCMTINRDKVPDVAYFGLTQQNVADINAYINNPMSAVSINSNSKGKGKDAMVSELIYYWMFSLGIPIEFEKRHLNQLLSLIEVFNIKNEELDPKKKGRHKPLTAEELSERRRRNDELLRQHNTKG